MPLKSADRLGKLGSAFGIGLALSFGAIATVPDAAAQSNRPIAVKPPTGAPMSFADLVEQVSPAVVSIEVVTEIDTSRLARQLNPFSGIPGFENFDDEDAPEDEDDEVRPERNGEGHALGSGFFISGDGYVVTNHHVVENAREVIVVLKGGDELEAEIIGTDEATDLAVLKVKKSGQYPHVRFAEKNKPRVGDWVVAVGNPFGLGGTATAGIVSADGRALNNATYNDFIQIDAPINRGNSGGPTFNLYGDVIGVNTAIYSSTGGGSGGIGFAIESGMAKRISDALIKDGKVIRGWLGVEIQNLNPNIAKAWGLDPDKGAVVNKVTTGSPAEAGGMVRTDVIIAVNDEEVENTRELTRKVGSLLAGSRNSFKVIRDGKEQTLWVTVSERRRDVGSLAPDPARDDFKAPEPADTDVEVLGGTVRALTAEEKKLFEFAGEKAGLLVVTTKPNGALDKSAIFPGDALLTADQTDLTKPEDLLSVVAKATSEGQEDIVVLVGCGDRGKCRDTTLLHTVEIK